MENNTVKLVIFDLDGTLVDSWNDIVKAFNHGLAAVGAGDLSPEDVQPLIGTPLTDMYEGVLPGDQADRVTRACEAYRGYYFDHCTDTTRLFPGVRETLDALAPTPLAIATTKKTFMAVKLIELLGLSDRFALVQGTDDIPPKPDPAVLFLVAETLSTRPETAWMVGDTVHDIQAAKRAGMKSCAVSYGVTSRRHLERAEPDLLVDEITAFAAHLL